MSRYSSTSDSDSEMYSDESDSDSYSYETNNKLTSLTTNSCQALTTNSCQGLSLIDITTSVPTVESPSSISFRLPKDVVEYRTALLTNGKVTLPSFNDNRLRQKFVDITNSFPNIPKPPQFNLGSPKIDVAVFEPIEFDDGDTETIEKMIDKTNYKFLNYACNHNKINADNVRVLTSIIDLYQSEDYHRYISRINRICKLMYDIRQFDESNFMLCIDNPQQYCDDGIIYDIYDEYRHIKSEVDWVMNCRDEINSIVLRISKVVQSKNLTFHDNCPRCDAMRRLYEYEKNRINRERSKVKKRNEERALLSITNTPTLEKLLSANVGDSGRLKLSDFSKIYRDTFGVKKTQDELRKEICDTGRFTVTNIHRTFYINRL